MNRSNHRPRPDPVPTHPTRITASIIIPTLGIDRRPHVRWAQPAMQKQSQTASFRLSTPANPPLLGRGGKNMERAASTSLPDLPLNSHRLQS